MMRPTSQLLPLLLLLTCIFLLCIQTSSVDKLEKGQNLTDGKTLVSAGGSFTLGFFSPGVSTKRYVGIWFSESNETVYWVANRDDPLGNRSGILVFNDEGSLVLLDGSGRMAWSSDFPGSASAAAARLLESGNLVVRNGSSDASLWQSFDYPCDTLLPGMKLGKTSWSGAKWELTSWRSADDPSPGDYRRTLETQTSRVSSWIPELVVWKGQAKTYRTGPWNGLFFNGVPESSTYSHQFKLYVATSRTETTYGYEALPGTPLTRVVLNHTGAAERLVWDVSSQTWNLFFKGPKDECDDYARCGPFGLCNAGAASRCDCIPGFSPASSSAWQLKGYAGGCRRTVDLECSGKTTTDRFKVVPGVKLPDTQNASVDTSITLDECKARCYANCSCLAYAAAYIQEGGGDGTGCIIWEDTIVDMRLVDIGQNLYLRLSKSEFDDDKVPPKKADDDKGSEKIEGGDPDHGKMKRILRVAAPVASAFAVLLGIFLILWTWRIIDNEVKLLINLGGHQADAPQNPPMAVHSVNLVTIRYITRNFSRRSIIGRGRFGDVYQAQLADGSMIAVKRLRWSAFIRKDKRHFATAVEGMARCRNGNLVRLLAYCNQCKERILVYEYMENNSLGFYIFDISPNTRSLLDWERRLEIIRRIADGVAYLHGGCGMTVIHGNLKPGNILLDGERMAKIADFGTAQLLGVDQMGHAQTIIVSPEYTPQDYEQPGGTALDVYSFGVTILETLSGQRNGCDQSLLLHVRELPEDQIMEFLGQTLPLPEDHPQLLERLQRFIDIGLYCVQQQPGDRPTMPAIVSMLAEALH